MKSEIQISSQSLEHQEEHSHAEKTQSGDFSAQWSGGEHKQLGDLGFINACKLLGSYQWDICKQNTIHRYDKKLPMSYGQVLALGDFYLNPQKAFLEKRRVNSINKLFRCIDKEGNVHEEQRSNPEADYPDCTWVNVIHGGDYLSVVTKNYEHFAWDNMKAYVKHHSLALKYARGAHNALLKGNLKDAELLTHRALFTNAFADHFLTDAFAAGHLRVPRYEVKRWAKKNTNRIFGSFIGDALGMILHDFEGKDASFQEQGLVVKNSLQHTWTTRSDSFMNVCAKDSDSHIQMPLNAVTASVSEILITLETGELPNGTFAATWYVPFPDDQGILNKWQSLLKQKDANTSIRKMRKHLPKPLEWIVKTRYIRRMIKNLPIILKDFNKRVQADLNRNPQLKERLPDPYLRNFSFLD